MKLVALASVLLSAFAYTAVAATAGASEAPAATEAASVDEDQVRRKDRPEMAQVRRAVQAFRLITASAGLRPGAASDAQRTAAVGGRSSSWHGRVFEYLRNDALDAVPHEVVQRGGDRNLRRRNQFGFTLNGPLAVPKLYDGRGRTFFTLSYEGTRERVGRSYLRTLATAQRRLGDFSDLVDRAGNALTIYDPASTRANPLYDASRRVSRSNLEHVRDPFPNNRIPSQRLDSVALAANREYPLPNTAVGPFYRNNYWSNPSERNTPDGFIARVDHNLGDSQKVTLNINSSDGFHDGLDIYPTAANYARPDREFVSRSVSLSDTVNLTANLTYRASVKARSEIVDTNSLLGDQNLPRDLGLHGVNGNVFPALRFRGYTGMGPSQRSYLRNALAVYDFDNELILRSGKHTWTITSTASVVDWGTLELDAPSGSFSFSDRLTGLPGINNTGDAFATFLLGQAWRAEATDQPQPAYLQRKSFQNSLGDQWQVRPNLTLSLRVTVDATSPRTEKYDRQSSFDLSAINDATGTPGALVFAGRNGQGRAFQPYRVRAEPRIGISWSPTESRSTVVRGSLLRSYSGVSLRSGPFATQGFSGRRFPVSQNRQLVPAVTLAQGFPALANPLPDLRNDFANGSDVDMIPATAAQPNFNHLSLEVERKLPKGLMLRARGRATRGRDLLVGGHIVSLNQVPLSALAYRDRLNDEAFRRSLRPFPHFQQIRANYQYPSGRLHYDEGQITLRKRTGDGLSFDFDYAYRRRKDDYSGQGVQNPHDRKSAWAHSVGFRPQRLSLSYTYELPMGPGRPLLGWRGPLAKLVSDWTVSGYTRWYSGDPIVLEPMFNNTGGIVRFLQVDAVPGMNPHVRDPGPSGWFNPHAFVDPPDFALGNVARSHPTLRNPDYRNHDISITKRVVLSQEQSVEVLVQSFNFLNQGNWHDPDNEIGPANARNVNAGRIIGSRGGRVLQLGLRYNF